jgi:putative ATP-dependent endonuclease of OLD family
MKLSQLTITNYRSIWSGDERSPLELELGDGLNALIGPNNSGKSNVLGALALALGEGAVFDRERDRPKAMLWSWPRIRLEFRFEEQGLRTVERTLLRYLDEYEKSAGSTRTFASRRRMSLHVRYEGDKRTERIVSGGRGIIAGDADLHERALRQFRACVRFVYIRSGQSLDNFLAGGIREVLESVLYETLGEELDLAASVLEVAADQLINEFLAGLVKHVKNELADVIPEVRSVSIEPKVPTVAETLSQARILVEDHAMTAMDEKGTGLRGTLLVAILKYLAQQSRRSMVFAVEEPESFLHPAAQEMLREDLEALCARRDVTLLVTTHSPFLVSGEKGAKTFGLAKDASGRTKITASADDPTGLDQVLRPLFRDSAIPHFLSRIAAVPPDTDGVLVVEGVTDEAYLRMACAKAKRSDLLDGIHVVPAGGAESAALQTISLRGVIGPTPLAVLLDRDDPGMAAAKLLTQKLGLDKKRQVFTYDRWVPHGERDVEAEDLFPDAFMNSFLSGAGDGALAEKVRRPNGDWHIGLTDVGKDDFLGYVETNCSKTDLGLFVKALEDIRTQMGLGGPSANSAASGMATAT